MKIINAKILILVMLINMLLPLTVFADGTITLYNHDEMVYLTDGIETYNNHYYISVKDLDKLELENKYSDELYINSDYNELIIYPETSIIELNGNSLLFQNPMKNIGGKEYVSLDLIAMVFSGIYETEDNSIYLWINTENACTVRGIISLPDNEVAPAGGVEISVFYGAEKFDLYDTQHSFSRYSETNVTIPEGRNSVEYVLKIPDINSKAVLGYEVDTDKYKELYTKSFHKNSGIINFQIYSNTVILSGMVSLPEITEKDVKFTVYAKGYNGKMYSCDGVISAGADYAPYSMRIEKYNEYSLSVVFEDKEYKQILREKTLNVNITNITGIDFETEKSNMVSGVLKLPENLIFEEDVEVTVILKRYKAPYYYLDSENIVIAAGSTGAKFTLYDDTDLNAVICCYELKSDNDKLFTSGYYNKNNTTVTNKNAGLITFFNGSEQNIEITMMKNIPLELKISLPDNRVAENNIYGNIYLTDVYEKFVIDGMNTVTPEPLIKKGESEAIKVLKVPDDSDFKYNIVLNGINDENDMFYDDIYYKDEGEATVLREYAKELTKEDKSIELTLMKQHRISGKIDTDVVCDMGMVYAIYQADSEFNTDVRNSAFKVLVQPDCNNNFVMYVPDELDNYAFRFDMFENSVYYSSSGIADSIDDAEVVTINNNTNIEILYEGFKPEKPLVIAYNISNNIYSGNITGFDGYVQLKNISDYEYKGENLYIASYNDNGRLLQLEALTVPLIYPHDYSADYKLSPYIDKNAAYVKIFVWSETFRPLADAYEISSVSKDITVDYKDAYFLMQVGNTTMYHNGEKFKADAAPCIDNDVLYVSARTVGKVFGAGHVYDSETQTILITVSDKTIAMQMNMDVAFVNGNEYRLSGKPVLINGYFMLSIEDLTEILGFNGKYISKSGEFVIYN